MMTTSVVAVFMVRVCSWKSGRNSRQDGGRFDIIEIREILFKVSVAFLLNPALVGPPSAGESFSILAINLVHNIHALRHFAEGREAHAIEAAVVTVADEELRGPRVRTGGGEADSTARIAGLDRVVGDPRVVPRRGDLRIAVDAELAHEAGDHAKKSDALEVAGANQVVETIRAVGRLRAGDFDGESAFGCVESHFEGLRPFLRQFGG